MTEKRPGFFKRIFSFGFGSKDADPQPATEAETTPPQRGALEPHEPASGPSHEPVDERQAGETQSPPPPPKEKSADATKPGKDSESDDTAPPPASRVAKPAAVGKDADEDTAKPPPPPLPRDDVVPQEQAKAVPAQKGATREPSQAAEKSDPPKVEKPGPVAAAPDPPEAGNLPAADPGDRQEHWFRRLKKGLSRSSDALVDNVAAIFVRRKLDEATLQQLEDVLIQADLGIETAMRITDALASRRMGREVTDLEIRETMAEEIEAVLKPVAQPLELDLTTRPHVMLVVGVNGSGKTTTIGKLAAKLVNAGYRTMLVAGDTFRAAAIEQLKIWGERTASPVVARQLGADAASLAFDAYRQAVESDHDVMIMDTAGRLQNKKELMAELEKIVRVLRKLDADAPHTVLLTLDATTGQNALSQVEIFREVAGVNGLVMTKLDGTARGGILVAIAAKFALPVYFVGVGEQVEDLEPFEARDFANSIAGLGAAAQAEEIG